MLQRTRKTWSHKDSRPLSFSPASEISLVLWNPSRTLAADGKEEKHHGHVCEGGIIGVRPLKFSRRRSPISPLAGGHFTLRAEPRGMSQGAE